MFATTSLPTELWLLIFESIIGSSIGPADFSTYINFPEMIRHLRSPVDNPPLKNVRLYELRLVCRFFKAQIERVLPTFLSYAYMNALKSDIPVGTKALYINQDLNTYTCLQRLLREPFTCYNLSILDISGNYTCDGKSTLAALCGSANAFPQLRTLIVAGEKNNFDGLQDTFWWDINEAFPHLTCLVVRRWVPPNMGGTNIVFQYLHILDVEGKVPDSTLHFPVLKHVAFGDVSSYDIAKFNSRLGLESLLVKGIIESSQFRWELFPRLKLLGIPSRRAETFGPLPPLPPDHPLRHLYVYVGNSYMNPGGYNGINGQRQYTWLKQLVQPLPTVPRITLAVDTRIKHQWSWIPLDFNQDTLRRLNISVNKFSSRQTKGTRLVVLNQGNIEATKEPAYPTYNSSQLDPRLHLPSVREKQEEGGKWKQFRDFASRKIASVS